MRVIPDAHFTPISQRVFLFPHECITHILGETPHDGRNPACSVQAFQRGTKWTTIYGFSSSCVVHQHRIVLLLDFIQYYVERWKENCFLNYEIEELRVMCCYCGGVQNRILRRNWTECVVKGLVLSFDEGAVLVSSEFRMFQSGMLWML